MEVQHSPSPSCSLALLGEFCRALSRAAKLLVTELTSDPNPTHLPEPNVNGQMACQSSRSIWEVKLGDTLPETRDGPASCAMQNCQPEPSVPVVQELVLQPQACCCPALAKGG